VLAPEQEAALAYLQGQPGLWADRDALLDGLRDYFLGLLARRAADEATTLANLQAICTHRRKTLDSLRAYATEGKPDPDALFWPTPGHPRSPGSRSDKSPFVKTSPFATRQTPIGSAGSCFAMEIAHRLQAEGFNYVITEPHVITDNGLPC